MKNIHTCTGAPALIAGICLLATVAGCQSRTNDADGQSMPEESSISLEHRVSASHTAPGQGLTTAMLTDASFNGMPATQVVVPKGWHVQGRMGSVPCSNLPSASWDASSPDGDSQINVLPVLGWMWGVGAQRGNGCIPLSGPVHAADFLQQFAARLKGVRVVGTMPVNDEFRTREVAWTNGFNKNNARLAGPLQALNMGDVAAIETVDSTGHQMRMRAWVECAVRQGRFQGGNCFARVDILRAPKGRLNALVALVDNHDLWKDRATQQWQSAYMNRQQQMGNGMMRLLRRNADAGNKALRDQYLSSSARLNAEHQAGMQEIQNATDSSMANAQASQDASSTSASDMEDYSLDQQTVSGANGIYKTSSQYSNVWSSPYGPANSDGRTFGSTDNTIDPNTATDNTWTQDTKVHGNGKPY